MNIKTLLAIGIAMPFATLAAPASADEGMWTFDQFPTERMQADYGWVPDQAWLDTVRASAVRLTGGVFGQFRFVRRADPDQPPLRDQLPRQSVDCRR